MLLQPITVPFSKSTLKPSVYTLSIHKYNMLTLLGLSDSALCIRKCKFLSMGYISALTHTSVLIWSKNVRL